MTEKRFEIVETKSDNHIAVLDTDDMTTHQMLDMGTAMDVCELLNKQDEEIKELKEAMKRMMIDMMSGGK